MPKEKQLITIVDEKDEIIGFKERSKVKKEDIYRVSALWITNPKGDILLARRGLNKAHDPGEWGPAVAGTVEKNESYLVENIIKEAREELGLEGIKPKQGPKFKVCEEHNFFDQWFTLVIDKPASEFKVQKEEIEEVKWFSRQELLKELKTSQEKFLPKMEYYVSLFASQQQLGTTNVLGVG